MKIGLVGLGRMGGNLALNMKDNGVDVVVFNRNTSVVDKYIEKGLDGYYSYEELLGELGERKIIWIMVPAGYPVDDVIKSVLPGLNPGDVVIDGGNSKYTDTIKRGKKLLEKGIVYMDVGTSGGTEGARSGACMMIGGDRDVYLELKPLFSSLCKEGGESYMGRSGSGHFVKMVHNGIEYGMMQAIGEGFEILEKSDFDIEYLDVAKVWSNGSIIESYLMDKVVGVFSKDKNLESVVDKVDASGEGLWTLEEALRLKVPAYVISASLMKRFESQQEERFSNKVVAALRNEFGGHKVYKK